MKRIKENGAILYVFVLYSVIILLLFSRNVKNNFIYFYNTYKNFTHAWIAQTIRPVSDPPYAAQQNTRGIMPRVSATPPTLP